MKVIDLLNKIANGEETHFDTKLNDKSVRVRYYNDRNFSSSTDPEMLTIADIIKSLNDEVEVIEDVTLKKLENLNMTKIDINKKGQVYGVTKEEMISDIKTLQNWVNKIIDKLNSMEE